MAGMMLIIQRLSDRQSTKCCRFLDTEYLPERSSLSFSFLNLKPIWHRTRVWHLLSIRFSGIEIFVFSQSIRRSEIDQTNVEMADVWDITGPGRGARPVARQKCRNVGSRGQYFLALMQGIVEHATWFRMKSTALWILRLGKSLAL